MPSSTPLLAGIDLGTTRIKAGLISTAGEEVATCATTTPWQRTGNGTTLSPDSLASAVREVLASLLRAAPPGEVIGVGISSIAETAILLDAGRAPLADMYPWHDRRAHRSLDRFREAFTARTIAGTTGLTSDQVPTLSMLQWLFANGVDLRRAAHCLSVAEWVATLLGGDCAAEPSLACRTGAFSVRRRTWWHEALEWAELPLSIFPPLRPAGAPWGRVPRLGDGLERLSGAAVTVAGHDHVVAAVGAGALDPSVVLDSCGTAEAIIRTHPGQSIPDPDTMLSRGVSVGTHVLDNRYYLLTGFPLGLVLHDALGQIGHEARGGRTALDRQVLDALDAPGTSLSPESTTWRDALLASAAATTSGIEAIGALAGPARAIIVTGGWSANPVLHRLKSEAGSLRYPCVTEAGVRGAALVAGLAAGCFRSSQDFPLPPMTSTPWTPSN